jgi:hypothetical protein
MAAETMKSLPPNPSNNDLADMIISLHSCVHQVDDKVGKTVIAIENVETTLNVIDGRVSSLEGYNKGFATRLGITEKDPEVTSDIKPMLLFSKHMKPLNILWISLAGLAAGHGGYTILVTALTAVHHALLNMK